ncbi:SCO2322 family protein [Streptomyces minutiscleroticus]|uniref:Secreted protein n=1 Tax=Streptomyces minutiscleroticus TaxID=68238 RepID=A0A918K980_9ACTN|nr:SCO2322 family protein [Streptomyces minutiscleroticus]GGX52481.1 hypothetical protein GCM10010358_02720 [Streptomyces minutiscleroticus]
MTRRRVCALVPGLVVAVLAAAAPAQAAGYRYWSFWERDGGSWVYATQGPASSRPADGSVQGFRFAVSADAGESGGAGDTARPRGAARFAPICARTPKRADRKRIALVLDFGTAADAPPGGTPPRPRTACASVAEDATTADALAAVAPPLRYDANALLCAIAGYPRTGCGERVPDGGGADARGTDASSASPAGSPDAGGPSVGIVAGVAVVAVLGAAGVWQARRRRG